MKFNKTQWNSMKIHETSMTFNETQWKSVSFNENQRNSIRNDEIHLMKFSEIQWKTKKFKEIQRKLTKFNEIRWHSMKSNEIQWKFQKSIQIQWNSAKFSKKQPGPWERADGAVAPPRDAQCVVRGCCASGFFRQTLEGSFSAVSKRNFASKYALESSCQDLHNALLCTVF